MTKECYSSQEFEAHPDRWCMCGHPGSEHREFRYCDLEHYAFGAGGVYEALRNHYV